MPAVGVAPTQELLRAEAGGRIPSYAGALARRGATRRPPIASPPCVARRGCDGRLRGSAGRVFAAPAAPSCSAAEASAR